MAAPSFSWPEIASRIHQPISLAAYGIAAVVAIVAGVNRSQKKPVPNAVWWLIAALAIVPNLTPAIVDITRVAAKPTWRVRVTVLDPKEVPVDNARVWSSLGGETKAVAGGWEIDVSSDGRPADGRLTVFAQVASAFETGQKAIVLGDDHSPSIILTLHEDNGAKISGTVRDRGGRPVPNATVSVDRYEHESVKTAEDGRFELNAHAADGQQVGLHAQAKGKAVDVYEPAGLKPVEIQLP